MIYDKERDGDYICNHLHVQQLSGCSLFCRVTVSAMYLFLTVPWIGLWYLSVTLPGHTHLLFDSLSCHRL